MTLSSEPLSQRLRRVAVRATQRTLGLIHIYGGDLTQRETFRVGKTSFRVSICNGYERSRWERLAARTKEPETLKWIETAFTSSSVFVDVGANVGCYSLYAAALHRGIKVYAFEPEPTSFVQLLRNSVLNANALDCFLLALSDKDGLNTLSLNHGFQAGESNHQFGRTLDSSGKPFTPIASFYLQGTRFDSLVARGIVKPPTHIKIDVDGAELNVLGGMTETLGSTNLRGLLLEINGDRAQIENTQRFVTDFGFKIVHRPEADQGNYIFER